MLKEKGRRGISTKLVQIIGDLDQSADTVVRRTASMWRADKVGRTVLQVEAKNSAPTLIAINCQPGFLAKLF
jgi:hypothetical protein